MQEGKVEEAYKVIQSFPDKIQQSRVMMDRAITLSQLVSEEEYNKQLSRLAKYHGDDPAAQFMLIDYYAENDIQQALVAFDQMVDWFKGLERQNDVVFEKSDFEDNPEFYGSFMESEAYKTWLK